MSHYGLNEDINGLENEFETKENMWRWYRPTFANATDPEALEFEFNVNLAGLILSAFLFTTSVISIISLICGEKSTLVKVSPNAKI